jgi:hypothetical protein
VASTKEMTQAEKDELKAKMAKGREDAKKKAEQAKANHIAEVTEKLSKSGLQGDELKAKVDFTLKDEELVADVLNKAVILAKAQSALDRHRNPKTDELSAEEKQVVALFRKNKKASTEESTE